MRGLHKQIVAPIFFSLAFILGGCKKPPQMQPGAPQVSVVTVQPERTSIVSELTGRIHAVRDAQIRARVTGIVKKIAFDQGTEVKANQLLFKIDAATYKAQYEQAMAKFKQAQATLFSAKLLSDRYAVLIKNNAVSQQEYDNALGSFKQAEAGVAEARANEASALINLSYTDVVSPIAGRIGKALVTEGALVEATSATQMANVQQLDPVYVDFNQSTTELSALRKAYASGKLQKVEATAARATIILEDGSEYEHAGKLLFTGITVEPSTGQVNLRAEVPNPDNILLPGMFVRIRVDQGVENAAFLVPQQALQRSPDGLQNLMLVKGGKVEQRAVTVGALVKDRWIVTNGLKAGDVVIVEGYQKVRPGMPVQATAWNDKR